MINNLKLGIRMIRYGSGLVAMVVFSVIFLVLGLIMDVFYTKIGIAGGPGDVFLVIAAMYPIQILYSLSVSSYIASSPVKKRMQTSVPAVTGCFGAIVIYLVNALCKGIMTAGHPENIGIACSEMVTLAGFAALILLYMGVAYKCFWMSIVMGIMVYFFTRFRMDNIMTGTDSLLSVNYFLSEIFGNSAGSFALALLIGSVIIVIGGFGQYGLSLLVYKMPMSKYAQSATVRKEM